MLPRGSAKRKPLHEIPTVSVYYLRMGNTLPKDSEAMEINIRRPSTLEIHRIKVIGLRLVKPDEESSSLTHWIKDYGKTAANLKLRRRRHFNRN